MRYYWEALFSVEYFPYWEFSMVMMLVLLLSILWRLNRIEDKINDIRTTVNYLFTNKIEGE
tara:strand:+ start:215 stop:397 length:183 start_codon:yes stop_codon:yes gene_type:complete